MIPSREKYTWAKVDLTKEALAKNLDDIKKMTPTEVKTNLEKYTSVNFNTKDVSNKTNTLEMTALYQKALQLLWYTDVTVDARFGPTTSTNLKKAQKEKLKFSGNKIDGLPGPETTKALVMALEKSEPKEEIIEDTPLQKAKKLLNENWYVIQLDWTYVHKINNTILQIVDSKIVAKSNPRLSSEDQEKKLILMWQVERLLNTPSSK